MKLSLFLLALLVGTVAGDTSGTTTRYWDCCKVSCAWNGKAAFSNPVQTCDKNDKVLSDVNAQSGCNGGSAYTCSSQQPWAVNDNLAYGFAAVALSGQSESQFCCACYELTFTSTAISGKKMVVQAVNTGGDVGGSQFDLQIPGGGVGIFNGCQTEWGAPSDGWGQRYGGVSSASQCSQLPKKLQSGCKFRFGWMKGADNPTMTYKRVKCPAAITNKTKCVRSDDSSQPAPSG